MMKPFSQRPTAALTGAIVLALALLAPLAPARAATVSYSLVLPTAATDNPSATSTSGTGATIAENVTGTIVNVRRSPWNASNSPLDPDDAGSVYSALYNNGGTTAVSASFDFGGSFDQLSLVWGTPGIRNSLKLFLDTALVFDMSNDPAADEPLNQLIALAASLPGARTSVLVKISGLRFDSMVIGADHRAMEFANLEVVLAPVPAGGLLLVTALGGLSLMRRRKAA